MKILKFGSQGYFVQEVQGTLNIRADGIFGNETYHAVREFQRKRGLNADGIVGPKTWHEIEKEAAAQHKNYTFLREMGTILYNVWLVPQRKEWACWYACGLMVRFWKRNLQQMTRVGEPDPSEIPQYVASYKANTGLTYSETKRFATSMGLKWASRRNETLGPSFIHDLLKNHGPLWAGGADHAVVITGINHDGSQLFINDPYPIYFGKKYTRDILWLNSFLPESDETPLLFNAF